MGQEKVVFVAFAIEDERQRDFLKGHLAIDNGKTVAWHTLATLAALLRRHQ
jgi:hypothetical protein